MIIIKYAFIEEGLYNLEKKTCSLRMKIKNYYRSFHIKIT